MWYDNSFWRLFRISLESLTCNRWYMSCGIFLGNCGGIWLHGRKQFPQPLKKYSLYFAWNIAYIVYLLDQQINYFAITMVKETKSGNKKSFYHTEWTLPDLAYKWAASDITLRQFQINVNKMLRQFQIDVKKCSDNSI